MTPDVQQLFNQLTISAALIAASTFLHAVFVAAGATLARIAVRSSRGPMRFLRDAAILVFLALWLMVAHLATIALWAEFYLRLDLFETFERALYFSAVSYTTLGFGDVILPEHWGLLAGAEAATGLLMFGLSAALLVEAGVRLRLVEPRP